MVDRRRPTPGGARRLIVLDDDAWSRALIDGVLRACGYRVVCTGDPEMAVRLAREMLPDLVLVDNSMKVVEPVPAGAWRSDDRARAAAPNEIPEGYALLRALEAEGGTAQFPIVLLNYKKTTNDGTPASRFGLAGGLPKPFTPETLIRTVQDVLGSLQRSADEAAAWASGNEHGHASDAGNGNGAGNGHASGAGNGNGAAIGEGGGHAADWVPLAALAQDPASLGDWAVPAPVFDSLPSARRSALVVDPDSAFRAFLRRVLALQDFTVHEAGSFDEALEIAVSKRPWLTIAEVDLPELDGFELCFRLRNHARIARSPLVFLSSLDDYWERHHALELGADDYLSKTMPLRELLIRLQLTLSRYYDAPDHFAEAAGMGGRIDLVGIPGILQMFHQGLLSGVCTFQAPAKQAIEVCFRRGEIVAARTSDGFQGVEVVFELLSWTRGRFEFLPGESDEGAPISPFEKLLLEGCRRMDEKRRQVGNLFRPIERTPEA
jgi:DNA-binding response OmpR family regulator